MQEVYKYNQGARQCDALQREKERKGEADQALLRSASMPPALAILSFRRRVSDGIQSEKSAASESTHIFRSSP